MLALEVTFKKPQAQKDSKNAWNRLSAYSFSVSFAFSVSALEGREEKLLRESVNC